MSQTIVEHLSASERAHECRVLRDGVHAVERVSRERTAAIRRGQDAVGDAGELEQTGRAELVEAERVVSAPGLALRRTVVASEGGIATATGEAGTTSIGFAVDAVTQAHVVGEAIGATFATARRVVGVRRGAVNRGR